MKRLALVFIVVVVACVAYFGWLYYAVQPPAVAFDPEKIDFARLDHEIPLSPRDLSEITPENLKGLSQEDVDQIYGRLTAGPIPHGIYVGDVFFARGVDGQTRLAEILGGGIKQLVADVKLAKVETLGGILWRGKSFEREARVVRNLVEDLDILAALVGVDSAGITTMNVPRPGPFGAILPNTEVWLMFPGKIYCGQSLLDGRRESVVMDYLFADDLPGYRDKPDRLLTRNGLKIRDEARMVRPGFYLGRAYMNRVFVANFTLYNADIASSEVDTFVATGAVEQDCWTGDQNLLVTAE